MPLRRFPSEGFGESRVRRREVSCRRWDFAIWQMEAGDGTLAELHAGK